jgi:hypothetical protein
LSQVSCESFSNGILKQGLFLAFNKFLEIGQELSALMIYYFDNKMARWRAQDGPCMTIPRMPPFLNNHMCIGTSKKMAELSKLFLILSIFLEKNTNFLGIF